MEASQIQHGEPRRLVMSAPTPLRQDFDAPQVRGLARKTKDGPQARRLLALAAIYDGATRTEAAKIGGVGLQIVRDWVLRFNARGTVRCSWCWRPSRKPNAPSLCGVAGRLLQRQERSYGAAAHPQSEGRGPSFPKI